MTTFKGFLTNELIHVNVIGTSHVNVIGTPKDEVFSNGFTSMKLNDLKEGVEGNNLLLHENLQKLLIHKSELEKGSRVNVYLEWELTEDRRAYKSAKVLKVEVQGGE